MSLHCRKNKQTEQSKTYEIASEPWPILYKLHEICISNEIVRFNREFALYLDMNCAVHNIDIGINKI